MKEALALKLHQKTFGNYVRIRSYHIKKISPNFVRIYISFDDHSIHLTDCFNFKNLEVMLSECLKNLNELVNNYYSHCA